MAGSTPSTMAPTPVTDISCMDFATSQNCRLSDVRCDLPNSSTFKHSCRCAVDRSECYQYKTAFGENRTYSSSCPCTAYQPFITSAIVFAIVASVMFVTCFLGLFLNRRSPRTIALRKAKVRQDPINIQLVTEHDYDAWQTREAAMQNFGSNLAASVQGTDPQMNPQTVENVVQVNLDPQIRDVDEDPISENNISIMPSVLSDMEETIVQIDIENQT